MSSLKQKNHDRFSDTLLLLVSGIFMFWALGDRSIYGSEARWGQIAREMMQTGDFFYPTIAGTPYFDKPLLSYWFVAGVSYIFGVINEWTVRFPAAIAGFVTILATVSIGRNLWSAQVGRIAGWILLGSYGFLFWARTGTAEAENLAAIVLAVAWYFSKKDKLNFFNFLIFYIILFLGSLTKGLTDVIVPFLVILPDLIESGRWKKIFKISNLVAFGIGALIYLSSFIYASHDIPVKVEKANGIYMVFKENIIRYINPFDHQEPIYLYFYFIPILILPWAPLLITSLAGMIRRWKELDKNSKWLLKAIALVFIFFTISGSRRGYYILCIIPFCALLIAVATSSSEPRNDRILRWGNIFQTILFLLIVFAELSCPLFYKVIEAKSGIDFPHSLVIITFVTGLVGFLAWIFFYFSKKRNFIKFFIINSLIILGAYFFYQQTFFDFYKPEKLFSLNIKEKMPNVEPERIAFVVDQDTNVLFYLNTKRPVSIIRTQEEIYNFLTYKSSGVLISKRRFLSENLNGFLDRLDKLEKIEENRYFIDSRRTEKQDKDLIVWFIKSVESD